MPPGASDSVRSIVSVSRCAKAGAATREWRYALPEGGSVLQVIADEVGGAAVAYFDPSGTQAIGVVWLDSRGRVDYARTFADSPGAEILGVNNRALVIDVRDEQRVVVVDRNGAETALLDATSSPVDAGRVANRLTDLNGFFVLFFDVSANALYLDRYSY